MSREQTELRPGGAPPASQASGHNAIPRSTDRGASPVPVDNQAGHHPEHEQDQPDLDAFVARFNGEDRTDGPDPAPTTGDAASAGDAASTDAAASTGSRSSHADDELPPMPHDHGANAGPADVPLHAGFRLTLRVVQGGVRGAGKLLHLGARLMNSVADRFDPPPGEAD